MQKSKADLMKALRKARKESGLVAVTVYVYPSHASAVKTLADNLRRGESLNRV